MHINIHDLHDLAEAAFTHDLKKVEVINGKSVLTVLDKVHANPHGAGAELDVNPISADLALGSLLLVLLRLRISRM